MEIILEVDISCLKEYKELFGAISTKIRNICSLFIKSFYDMII